MTQSSLDASLDTTATASQSSSLLFTVGKKTSSQSTRVAATMSTTRPASAVQTSVEKREGKVYLMF